MNVDTSPVFILRGYAWAVLKANTTLTEADYGGLVPIVPVAEEPELDPNSKPHIVYGYALDSTADLYAVKTGSMTFVTYSANFRELTKILTILQEAFGRYDDTARDINNYSIKQGGTIVEVPGFTTKNNVRTPTVPGITNPTSPYLGVRFNHVSVGFVEGGTPEDTEGGRQSGLINIRFEYVARYNVNTKV